MVIIKYDFKIARSKNCFLNYYKKYKTANIMKNIKVPNENIYWNQKCNAFIDRTLPLYLAIPSYRRFLSFILIIYI
jgi:hypothetical protein